MIMTTIQKIIQIGSSKGTTLPAKELKRLGLDVGDEIEIIVRKKTKAIDNEARNIAVSLLDRYADDFKNLAHR